MKEFFDKILNDYLAGFAVRFVCALLLLVVGFLAVHFLTKKLKKLRAASKMEPSLRYWVVSAVRIVLDVIIIVVAVQILGIPSASILAVLGSLGLTVGLALQGGLSNLVGGFMIMIFKPFRTGDYISAGGFQGTVRVIGIFYTRLTTLDNRDISIPNALLSNTTVSNMTYNDTRRIDLEFSVSYRADLDRVRAVLIGVAEKEERILKEPKYDILVSGHGDSAIKVLFRPWVKTNDYLDVKFALMEQVKRDFDKYGVEIPYSQLDVHVKND
ncbi:MAG: mechanosensitive ion channel [Clostridia bacterium]|nr:mechanosensitive ion channel [Clostridia bacterium]